MDTSHCLPGSGLQHDRHAEPNRSHQPPRCRDHGKCSRDQFLHHRFLLNSFASSLLIPHCSVCIVSWPDTSHTFLGHLSSLRRDDLQRLRIKRRIVCDLRLSRLVCFESGSGYKIWSIYSSKVSSSSASVVFVRSRSTDLQCDRIDSKPVLLNDLNFIPSKIIISERSISIRLAAGIELTFVIHDHQWSVITWPWSHLESSSRFSMKYSTEVTGIPENGYRTLGHTYNWFMVDFYDAIVSRVCVSGYPYLISPTYHSRSSMSRFHVIFIRQRPLTIRLSFYPCYIVLIPWTCSNQPLKQCHMGFTIFVPCPYHII